MARTTIAELWETIEFLNAKVEALTKKHHSPHFTLDNEMINLIRVGKYIQAIKLHRDRTKSSLLESKNYAESLREEVLDGKHGPFNEEHYEYLLRWRKDQKTD